MQSACDLSILCKRNVFTFFVDRKLFIETLMQFLMCLFFQLSTECHASQKHPDLLSFSVEDIR